MTTKAGKVLEAVVRGILKLILGPMYSGKSTSLRGEARRYALAGLSYVVVMSTSNTREDALVTHDDTEDGKTPHPAIKLECLSELESVVDVSTMAAILIDEVFMFRDVEDTVNAIRRWLDAGIDVTVSSLDTIAEGSVPRTVVGLMALKPDVIERKTAICMVRRSPKCDVKKAEHTMIFDPSGRLIPREELEVVRPQAPESKEGPKDTFKVACVPCYYNFK